MEEAAKHPVPAGKFVRVAASAKACSDYRVVAAWSGFLTFIGTGAFVLGMAIHNEAIAQQQPPRSERIWLRAEVDMPEQDIYSGPPASRFPYLTCQETPDWRCCRAMVTLVFDPKTTWLIRQIDWALLGIAVVLSAVRVSNCIVHPLPCPR
jgi:hypothetical protein